MKTLKNVIRIFIALALIISIAHVELSEEIKMQSLKISAGGGWYNSNSFVIEITNNGYLSLITGDGIFCADEEDYENMYDVRRYKKIRLSSKQAQKIDELITKTLKTKDDIKESNVMDASVVIAVFGDNTKVATDIASYDNKKNYLNVLLYEVVKASPLDQSNPLVELINNCMKTHKGP